MPKKPKTQSSKKLERLAEVVQISRTRPVEQMPDYLRPLTWTDAAKMSVEQLAHLPRTVRYRLLITVGHGWMTNEHEEEFLNLKTDEEVHVLRWLLAAASRQNKKAKK